MNYQSALEFLQKSAALGSRPGLERLMKLLPLCNHPEEKLKFVHVAGTNGKGSTCMMISSILNKAGYRVGLFTSPYLEDVTEQIRINGEIISNEDFSKACHTVAKAAALMEPDMLLTEFELLTAIAFVYFNEKHCDIVILEAGMGGLLDATNVIPTCEVAVLTNIGMDHMQYLGDTIEAITKNKAGIIKPKAHVVSYELDKDAEQVVRSICNDKNAPLVIASFQEIQIYEEHLSMQKFSYKDYKDISLPLIGEHQRRNAAVALETIEVLNQLGYKIPKEAVYRGMFHVSWPGRFEILFKKPLVVLDGGHNPQCITEATKVLQQYVPNKKIIFVVGVMADKDYKTMMKCLMPMAKEFHTVTVNHSRTLSSEALASTIHDLGGISYAADSIEEGVMSALNMAKTEDVICILGSLYMVSDVKKCFI